MRFSPAFLLYIVGLLFGLVARADDSDGGWGELFQMNVIPIHAMILPDGKVLLYGADTKGKQGGGSYYEIWDAEKNNHQSEANHVLLAHNTGVNIFCSNLSLDPSTGNIVIMGGDGNSGENFNNGVNDALEFNTKTFDVRNHPKGDMNYDRWYATSVNLPDGRIFVAGGESGKNHVGSTIPEVWSPRDGFTALPDADIPAMTKNENWWYPHVYVNSKGRIIIIMANGNSDVYVVGVDGTGSVKKIGNRPFTSDKLGASIMYDINKVVMLDNDGVLWSVDIADANKPAFTSQLDIGPMRTNAAMSLLPDGRVIITGGCNHANKQGNTRDCAVRNLQIWDPVKNKVFTGPNQKLPRLYHSSGLILPDGSVFSAGGGAPGPLKNHNGQVYYPGYMSAANRPGITAWPGNIEAGKVFVIKVKNSARIEKVTATKPGSMTHARNCDARFLNLGFTVDNDTTIIVSTPGPNIAIPGLWYINVLDSDDVPSPARLIGVNMATLPGGDAGGSSPTMSAPTPAVPGGGGGGQQDLGKYAMMRQNQKLDPSKAVTSDTSGFSLKLEASGLLALYQSSAPNTIIWRAEPLEKSGTAGRVVVQGDGHFIMRAIDNSVLWKSNNLGDGGGQYFLTVVLDDDPKIAMVNGTPDTPGSIFWSEPIAVT